MLGAVTVIVIAGAATVATSYVMWRASRRSGLWGLIAGVVLGLAAFGAAVLIGLVLTRAWLPR